MGVALCYDDDYSWSLPRALCIFNIQMMYESIVLLYKIFFRVVHNGFAFKASLIHSEVDDWDAFLYKNIHIFKDIFLACYKYQNVLKKK